MRFTAALLVCLFSLPSSSFAKDEMKPLKDYNRLTKDIKKVPRNEREATLKRRSIAYLAKWKAGGKTAAGTNLYAIAQFQQAANELKASMLSFRMVRKDTAVKRKTRDFAANAEANLLSFQEVRSQMQGVEIDNAVADLAKHANEMEGDELKKGRTKLRGLVARLHTMGGKYDKSLETRMQILEDDPKKLADHTRPILLGLLQSTSKLSEFDDLRALAGNVVKKLRSIKDDLVTKAKRDLDGATEKVPADALDAEGNLKQTDRKKMTKDEKAYGGAKKTYDMRLALEGKIAKYEPLFKVLGTPAPAWTAEHAFGGGDEAVTIESLKGKVVVLDFWATWTPDCNFPIMRDLKRDFADKGVAIIGVTETSNVVYASRFDYDADHKSKDDGGGKRYAARLASESSPADGQYILAQEGYSKKEIEAIDAFIGAHELSWPHVMVAKGDSAAKYAQVTWPHVVVLDKAGRIRLVRGGKIVRGSLAAKELHDAVAAMAAE